MNNRKQRELEQEGYDLDFLAHVQPQGNFKRHSHYIETGDGYFTCLRIFKYPAHGLQAFWGAPLSNNKSTIAIFDYGTENKAEIKDKLNR